MLPSIRSLRYMNREIGHHAACDKMLAHEIPDCRRAALRRQLPGNGDIHLLRQSRIVPSFARLDPVPELFPVAHPIRGTLRSHNLLMLHVLLGGVVMHTPATLVPESLAGAIGGVSYGTRTRTTGNGANLECVDRHIDAAGPEPTGQA